MNRENKTFKEKDFDESKALTTFINSLSEIMLSGKGKFSFEIIDYSDSFGLIKNIIYNFKLMCKSPKDNKKFLLLELFQSYFLNDASFKEFKITDIESFSNIIQNYHGKFILEFELQKTQLKFINQHANQFLDFLFKIEKNEDFFSNIGIKLLNQNGYTPKNLIKYIIYILSYKKYLHCDMDNIMNNITNLSYETIIKQLNDFSKIFNSSENESNLCLIYKNNFDLVTADIKTLEKSINEKCYDFPNSLRK